MPCLFHRPPKYSLHKGTRQAVVSLRGKRIYLGPFGSAQSHAAYQEVLQSWYKGRDVTLQQKPAEEPTANQSIPHKLNLCTVKWITTKIRYHFKIKVSELRKLGKGSSISNVG